MRLGALCLLEDFLCPLFAQDMSSPYFATGLPFAVLNMATALICKIVGAADMQ